ncbi:MAG TPA: alkaline phosphatase family protein [Silvibacterium sp.]|jgi:phospholipase C|nr:alkaline phosphatase family protein [Silvibacterium sp.]
MNRRQFNQAALLAGGTTLLGAAASRFGATHLAMAQTSPSLPSPESSGIEHIVSVTMENRSFDHFFGWMPNADGEQAGLSYVDNSGVTHATHSLSGDNTGCPGADPDHSYAGSRVAYDGGMMDGFLRAGSNDTYCIGYYGENDIPFYAALAQNYTTCDQYFAAILGPTFANRMFIHAAQTDRLTDSIAPTSLPTIWDSLAAANVSHAYYFNNVPYLALWGIKYLGITKTYDQFKEDAANGTLPAVSFLDPRYTILDDGTGNDDHPHADIREGDKFLYDVFKAVSEGPDWSSTVLIINFDEWGGFFEHVPPPRAQAANDVDTDIVNGKTLLGMRIPVVVASPFSAGDPANPIINSLVFDHTSVLKLIEWRWGLQPLTPRDASSDVNNLAYALNFNNPQTAVPSLPKPHTPFFVVPCFEDLLGGIFGSDVTRREGVPSSSAKKTAVWRDLRTMSQKNGFPVQ